MTGGGDSGQAARDDTGEVTASDDAGGGASTGDVSAGGPDGPQGAEDSSGGSQCPLSEVFTAPCNAIAPSGPLVTPTCSTSEPPQPQGGTVEDGTYVLESATWYGGCQSSQTVQTTWLLCEGLWDVVEKVIDSDAGTVRVNYASAVQGTVVTLNPICSTEGALAGMDRDFTASGGRLMLMTSYGASVLVGVYDRQ